MKKKAIPKIIGIMLLGCIILVFLLRLTLPRQLDDVSPAIECDQELLDKSDVFFIVPNYQGTADIANETQWCQKIIALNKELALHGVTHNHHEFTEPRGSEYLAPAITSFKSCFNQTPFRFKPPQTKWSKENDWMKKGFEVDTFWNQLFHKVYHCNDTGRFPNKLIELF